MAGIELKQYSTGDIWTLQLADANGWIDISSAFAVKLYGKVTGGASLGPLVCTIVSTNTFTATTNSASNLLETVSAFTGITDTSTLVGPGIPAGTLVTAYDSVAGTITMSNAATASGTGISIKANVGVATYQPLSADVAATGQFGSEAAIHWDNTNTLVTIVPNKAANNPTITIDANLTGAAE